VKPPLRVAPTFFFVAAPPPGTEQPSNIWVLGNSGIANAKARAVRDAYLKYKANQYTHLWLMLGDNAQQNGTDSDYQDALFNTYPTLLRQTTLWPALGHRDDGVTADSASQSGAYYDIFTLPKQGEAGGLASGTEAYYSFDYSNIHFVVLDSVETSKAPSGAMLTWLENDLAATTQPWIIAYWDRPPCSKGFHDSDTEIALREMRENVLPILEDASVDLVLNVDCGSYERSFPIDGHSGSSVTFEPQTMLVDGGDESIDGNGEYQTSVIDRPIRDAVVGSSGETQVGSLDYPVIYVSLKTLGSMALNVNGLLLDAVFLDNTGQVRHRFRMVKTTDTKASTSAPGVPTTELNPTPQTVTVSPTGATIRDAAANTSLRSSNTSATTQDGPTTGTLNADKVSTAPVIEGRLSERGWNLQTSIGKSVIGIGNNTTTFDVLWDNSYLYVGAKVLDSIFKNDSPNAWDDDGIEIYIDPNHSHSTIYDATDLQLIKGYNDAALYAAMNNNTSGVLHNWAAVSGGYTVELAIPWSKLGVTPTANMTIGFDIGVNDDDNGSARDAQMMWNGTSNNYRNTSAFGHTVLVAASDTTPPSTPTGLTATAASSSQIDVSWNASTDNVGVTGYKIYRGGAQIATTTGTSYSNTGLSPSITYSYAVAAYDAAANTSAQSTSGSATTQATAYAAIPTPTKTAPIVSVKNFGATGDGVTDDTTAIQKAMNSMTSGGTLEFPAGTYKYNKQLTLTKPNVKLWGYRATLIPTNPDGNGISLEADNTHMYGFTRTAPSSWPRGCGSHPYLHLCYGIYITNSRNHEIIDNTINYGLGGPLVLNASDVLIARNTVYRTTADAIHMTGASTNIRVLQNTTRENGDDGIAVVGYERRGNEPGNINILIEGNDVSGNYWGRGIAVSGGKDVTIRKNKVSKIFVAAGIYVSAEGGWDSSNNRNILVENNDVSDVQTTVPAWQPVVGTKTGHPGIFVYAEGLGVMSDLMFRNNTLDNTWKHGVWVIGNVSKTSIVNTKMTRIGLDALAIEVSGTYCFGSTDDGSPVTDPQCTASSPSSVTGSSFP
jgi:polygalacturonase